MTVRALRTRSMVDAFCEECSGPPVFCATALTPPDAWGSSVAHTAYFCAVECLRVWAIKQGLTQ